MYEYVLPRCFGNISPSLRTHDVHADITHVCPMGLAWAIIEFFPSPHPRDFPCLVIHALTLGVPAVSTFVRLRRPRSQVNKPIAERWVPLLLCCCGLLYRHRALPQGKSGAQARAGGFCPRDKDDPSLPPPPHARTQRRIHIEGASQKMHAMRVNKLRNATPARTVIRPPRADRKWHRCNV